jgi:anti-sigma B factor antagonist
MADPVPFAVDVRFQRARRRYQDLGGGHPERGLVLVAISGEVDLATVPELRSALHRVISPSTGEVEEVVVDLAAVEFIDASGVGALVGAAAEAARVGIRFRLQAPSPPVERVLSLARLDGSIDPAS